ncbi:MAG: hypothetical protein AYK19_11585 [Theionarchaea archaeon DG-70-1]|nr:MAG: hypothetical protein AYK19_11585 [Theionarchaea archaeon DG-70-1]
MENRDTEPRVRHIRLPVKEDTEERPRRWSSKKSEIIPERDYTEGVNKISESSFKLKGKKINIFKIKLTGKPTSTKIDDIFKWFKAEPTAYLSPQEILLRSSSDDFNKKAVKLKKKARILIRTFVEEVTILKSKDKMSEKLSDIILHGENYLDKLKLIIVLVPGFDEGEIQDLLGQISSLISESSHLEILDLENGILLSSVNVEEARSLVKKPYVFQISEDVEMQPSEAVKPFKTPPDVIPPKEDDPLVCVIDTGADPKTLGNALIECLHEDYFVDGIDTHGHGTQVSSVVIWGQDMFSEKDQVTGKCRVISYKFNRNGPISLLYRAVDNAFKKFSPYVRIFNLSANIYNPKEKFDELTAILDRKIQRKNAILVNSVGNILEHNIEKIVASQKYPEYLLLFSILPPADGNNIVAVGSYAMKPSKNMAKEFEISPYSPLGKGNSTHKESQKPDILVRGGNYEFENGKIMKLPELGVPVIGLNREFSRKFGTSFAAPLAASLLAQLCSFYPDISNSETLRALLVSASELLNTGSEFTFQLKDEENLFFSKNHLTYYAEGILPARIEYIQTIRKFRYMYNQVNFFVPGEAKNVRIITVHSDDLPVSKLGFLGSILKVDVYRPERLKKLSQNDAEIWRLNRNTPINFADFPATQGTWNVRLTIESPDLSRSLTNTLMVRYGLVIRMNLQEKRTTLLHSIRETVISRMDTF